MPNPTAATDCRQQALAQVSDPVAVKLVTWPRLISDTSNATFSEIVGFTDANPGWPRMATLNLRAERALLSYPMSNEDVVEWFSATGPETGEGRIRYGKALIELGRTGEGAEWIRRAGSKTISLPRGRRKSPPPMAST